LRYPNSSVIGDLIQVKCTLTLCDSMLASFESDLRPLSTKQSDSTGWLMALGVNQNILYALAALSFQRTG
jgi:hypothetical protein